MDCLVCGRPEKEQPSIFRGEKYCSDKCRKILEKIESQTKTGEKNGNG